MSKNKERVLTEKESARSKRIDGITEDLEKQGYVRKDQIIGILYANVMAIVLSIPFIILFVAWYLSKGNEVSYNFPLVGYLVFILLIGVHEGIHGLTWGMFAPSKFKTIEFGFIAQKLTPYCYCGEPLKKGQYLMGSFMPCLVLGIIPCVVAVYINSFYLLILGILMIIGAGGDLMIILKMLFSGKTSYISTSMNIILKHTLT